MNGHVLAIDQGTTSTRALVFDVEGRICGLGQQEFTQHFPAEGQVEHDAREIWHSVVQTAGTALERAGVAADRISALGVTNQRETVVVWDRRTGTPLHRAIVWQDRRTAAMCDGLRQQGLEEMVSARTGLLLDPYFSGTKLAWLLDTVDGLRSRAEAGEVCFGTIDSWLIWNLTGGRVHATDATNASRTLLYNIADECWDEELLALFRIPAAMLPDVRDSAGDFGNTDPALFGAAIAIRGVAGDQQAATAGNACFRPGMMKATYGTGCFALLNTGTDRVKSGNGLLTTIACRLGGRTTYALEGSIFIAGAAVQWLRDGLGVISRASESGELAARADPTQTVVLVPAFTGLGAPHWDPHARGALFGLTRNTGPAELARAALESVAFQTLDLLEAMHADWSGSDASTVLRVDGGMVESDWAMQRLADILAAPVDRPVVAETTALGAAWLAGFAAGTWPDQDGFARSWALERRFEPSMQEPGRTEAIAHWKRAVERVLSR